MSLVGPTGLRQNKLCILKSIIKLMHKCKNLSKTPNLFMLKFIMFYSLSVPSSVTLTRTLIVQVFKC